MYRRRSIFRIWVSWTINDECVIKYVTETDTKTIISEVSAIRKETQ